MIELYYWTTPNGQKPLIFLEEIGVPYKLHPVDISKGEQLKPEFLKISPNNKIPAMVENGFSLFESGALLIYMARTHEKFLPKNFFEELKVLEWVFWQVGGLGPMSGQAGHFKVMAKEKVPYAIKRFEDEVKRLYKVADTQLGSSAYLANDEYTIADIATYPWVVAHEKIGLSLSEFPHLEKWFQKIKERPAVKRAYEIAKKINPDA